MIQSNNTLDCPRCAMNYDRGFKEGRNELLKNIVKQERLKTQVFMPIQEPTPESVNQRLVQALEDANELCRSAYQIADNICEEYGSPSFGVNFEAFRDRLKEPLSRQQQALEQAKRSDCNDRRN